MEKKKQTVLPLRTTWGFLEENGLSEKAQEIRSQKDRIGDKVSTFKRIKVLNLLKKKNLLDKYLDEVFPEGKKKKGKSHLRYLENQYKRYYSKEKIPYKGKKEDEDDHRINIRPTEKDVENFLKMHLNAIEEGLIFKELQKSVITPKGIILRIDIFAEDKEGTPVVIELKKDKGKREDLGQVEIYKNLLMKEFKTDHIRIIFIANQITEQLVIATKDKPYIQLQEYDMSFSMTSPIKD